MTRLTGLVTVPSLGTLTTSPAGGTDAAAVQRTWGLLATTPSRRAQAYGDGFSFREYLRPRNWLTGIAIHYGLMLLGLVMLTPWLRRLALRFVTPPGQGPDPEVASRDEIEYRGIGRRDGGAGERAICRAEFRGSTYYCKFFFLLFLSFFPSFFKFWRLGGGGWFGALCRPDEKHGMKKRPDLLTFAYSDGDLVGRGRVDVAGGGC
ncbi:hypothetical protein VTG60DRAFT_3811 [Thermothelomyces hinnuleus]